jgi:hypothetical protein
MNPVISWFEQLWSEEKRILSDEKRHAERENAPPLVAFYWDGAMPVSHPVRDVSLAGMYLLTAQRWYPGTVVRTTLVRTDKPDTEPHRWLELLGRVARSGTDGVALAFLLPDAKALHDTDEATAAVADEEALRAFLAHAA